MPETKAEMCSGNLETALFELIRNAVRTEVQNRSSGADLIRVQGLDLPQRKKIHIYKKTRTKNGSIF
jgi:hypothetical protein